MSYANAVFTALGDPTRREIFELVVGHPRPVGEIARAVGISQPAVSQHLRTLRDAGLVDARPLGTRRIYYGRTAGLEELRTYVDSLWTTALAAFVNHLEKETVQDDQS